MLFAVIKNNIIQPWSIPIYKFQIPFKVNLKLGKNKCGSTEKNVWARQNDGVSLIILSIKLSVYLLVLYQYYTCQWDFFHKKCIVIKK